MPAKRRRVTQREIAEIAGVSQAVVSIVLNDREDTSVRIPEATRERVKLAIEQATYVADPAARRLAGLDNKIIGVFTYEPALSPETMDFYGPLLSGLERSAEQIGCDLLFFTSTPVENGKRSLFHRKTRLRLADGCVLLGQDMNGAELQRLVDEGFPFVAVGRRDEAPAVPYVGIDYVLLTAELVDAAVRLGHTRAIYLYTHRDTPAARDRFDAITAATGLEFTLVDTDLADLPAIIERTGATVVFAQDVFLAEDAARVLGAATVPAQVSVTALSDVRGHRIGGGALSGFHTPRAQVAAAALALLQRLVTTPPEDWSDMDTQVLLTGTTDLGDTLVRAAR